MFLLDEGKANTHLTHLEELVLTQGPKGYDMARAFLLELLEELKGNVDSKVRPPLNGTGLLLFLLESIQRTVSSLLVPNLSLIKSQR